MERLVMRHGPDTEKSIAVLKEKDQERIGYSGYKYPGTQKCSASLQEKMGD